MQDRVSANPGRVLITPESGDAYYAKIERADNPTSVGTPLNKANLLTDATASDYGLTSSATPNTMFQALKTNHRPWRVGDILETARTDLGSDWLLCNGAYVDKSDYPALYNLLPKVSSITKTLNISPVSCCAYGEGYLAVGVGGDVYSKSASIAYTSDPIHGTWTIKSLPITGLSPNVYIDAMVYDNGYWVICGHDMGYHACVWYSQSITGSFTCKIIYEHVNKLTVYTTGICYGGGYWSISANASESIGSNYTNTYVFYTDDLTGDAWTTKQIARANLFSINGTKGSFGIAYKNGQWAVAYGYQKLRIYYTSSLSSSWSYYDAINDLLGAHTYNFFHFTMKNNYFVVCGNYVDTDSSLSEQVVVYASSITGTWRTITGESDGSSAVDEANTYLSINFADYIDGQWVFVGKYQGKYGYALKSSITSGSTLSFTTITAANDYNKIFVMPSDDIFLFSYWEERNDTTMLLRDIPSTSVITSQLPTISVSNARAYIRAEE